MAVDVLPSWRAGAARSAILDFLAAVTDADGPSFVPPDERVAVFDNDGTLWCEKPMPVELGFILRRLAKMADEDPALRDRQPWKAAREQDFAWLGGVITRHYQGDDRDVKVLMGGVLRAFADPTVDEYSEAAGHHLREGQHPTLGRGLCECFYQPMIELLEHLESAGFTTYIASGGDRIMRAVTGEMYGIPPERVVGSSNALRYREGEDGGTVVYRAEPDFFDDGHVKLVRIWSRTGRRPLMAGGNSNGDLQMLQWSGAKVVLERARIDGWTVVSMRDDWSAVFADTTT